MQYSKVERAKIGTLSAILEQLRPKQWSKNILVFAALIFSINKASVDLFIQTIICFILFCFISSCVYILNDYLDLEADRQHPVKRNRPMASGALHPYPAFAMGILLLLTSLGISLMLNVYLFVVLLIYFFINVLYCLKIKHVVILDVMTIATGFVLRAIGGGIAINLPLTPWFLICTMLLSLFLAIGKRSHEYKLALERGNAHRRVLQYYNGDLLGQMSNIVSTAVIISYGLFTFTSGRTIHLMWTIPLVIYGVFRYLYLINIEGKGGSPDKILFEDKHILITVTIYAAAVIFILAFFE